MRIQPTPLTTQPKREQHPHVDAMGSTWIGEIGIVGTAAAMSDTVHHAAEVRVRDPPITLDALPGRPRSEREQP